MTGFQLLDALNDISPAYIAAAQTRLDSPALRVSPGRRPHRPVRRVLAIAALTALMATLLAATALAASPTLRQAVQKTLEQLFPPKTITVPLEGESTSIPHTAQGVEPQPDTPGYVMYVDPASYTSTEQDGVLTVRPIPVTISREEVRSNNSALLEGLSPAEQEALIDQKLAELEAYSSDLPVCGLTVTPLPQQPALQAAQALYAELQAGWSCTEPVLQQEASQRVFFSASAGQSWNSPQQLHYFYPDERGGCYHIRIEYFLEAAEGHGARLNAMLESFAVIPPEAE